MNYQSSNVRFARTTTFELIVTSGDSPEEAIEEAIIEMEKVSIREGRITTHTHLLYKIPNALSTGYILYTTVGYNEQQENAQWHRERRQSHNQRH